MMNYKRFKSVRKDSLNFEKLIKTYKTYKDAKLLNEYFEKSNFLGFLQLRKDRIMPERVLWFVINLAVILATCWILFNVYLAFIHIPTVTNRLVNRIPISNVHFPSVAICSGSRFNNRTLWDYAEKVYVSQKNKTFAFGTTEDVFLALKLIGSFFSFSYTNEDYYIMDKLHTVLFDMYDGPYPVRDIMRSLAINCSEFLIRCKFLDSFIDCEKIFQLRTAYIGVCCIFNYDRKFSGGMTASQKEEDQRLHVSGPGIKNGLSVVVDDDFRKYTFKLYSSVSTKIAVFESPNYPDVLSSSISENHFMAGKEVSVAVYPFIIRADPAMRKFPPHIRNCFFQNESNLPIKGFYSLSECLIQCRIKDIYEFCGCTPPQFVNPINSSYCLLSDISCLSRWMNKWMTYEPTRYDSANGHWFLQCPACRSRCQYVKFRSKFSHIDITEPANGKFFDYGILENLTQTNLSLVHVYFAENYAVEMEQSFIYDWFNMLGILGGVCGLLLGGSFISLIEMGYFLTGKFFGIWIKQKKGNLKGNQLDISIEKIHALYWKEFRNN